MSEFREQLTRNMIEYTKESLVKHAEENPDQDVDKIAECLLAIARTFNEMGYPQEFYTAIRVLTDGLDKMDQVAENYVEFFTQTYCTQPEINNENKNQNKENETDGHQDQ